MKKLFFIISIFISYHYVQVSGQGLYTLDTIQKIEISFSQSNWDYMLDTAKNGSDNYIMAQWVRINGVQIDSVGVKYKGNSSYDSTHVKNPLHIELNTFVPGQDYQGYTDIKLSNGFLDPSMVREVLGYKILKNYMHCSKANFAQVYINGVYYGLYSSAESVNKNFVANHFYISGNPFFKCNSPLDQQGYFPNLVYLGTDSASYYHTYEIKSNSGWQGLINLCDSLTNNSSGIHNILDVDRALWMLAFNNVLINLDSYTGASSHNYYLYMDNAKHFNTIIWDINMSFGSFNMLNPGPSGQLTITQMQQMSPLIQSTNSQRPLIQKLLSDPMYKRIYIAHMRTILNEHFASGSYINEAQNLMEIIDTAYQSDPNKMFSYTQFQNAITQNTTYGPLTIPGLQVLMDARTNYLNSTTEFQQVPPVVSNIHPSDTLPPLGSTIFITANVTNATKVYLGLRYSIIEKFTTMMMYDDGAHGDGVAGDGIYGISVTVTSPEIQYFIYAENSNAGIFSPQRAEHEYYTIDADHTNITAGQVVINEIMAINNSTVQNNNGKYSDWVELYNNTPNTVSLDNLYLSDNVANPAKWQFPSGVIIPPKGFLIVWADNATSSTELHCNFKFSGSGEQAIISYSNGYVVDSVTFPVQTADISWGRFPNGTGPYGYMSPTFNAANSPNGIDQLLNTKQNVSIYPNPTNSFINVEISDLQKSGYEIKIFNMSGKSVFRKMLYNNFETLNINFPSGIYIITVQTKNYSKCTKLIIM